ncbi:MAG: DUF805 domain-containing protein [Verrucomicrobiota bacterium]
MDCYIARDNQTEGPFPEEQIRQWVARGELRPTDLVCPVGGQQWQKVLERFPPIDPNLPSPASSPPAPKPAPRPKPKPQATAERNPYRSPATDSTVRIQSKSEKLTFWQLLFSFHGRIRRRDYWLLGIVVGAMFLIPAFFVASMIPESEVTFDPETGEYYQAEPPQEASVGLVVGLLLVIVPSFWSSLAISAKRWHDRNKSALWILIGLVPYIGGIWTFIECGLLAGTDGDNQYGADPKQS